MFDEQYRSSSMQLSEVAVATESRWSGVERRRREDRRGSHCWRRILLGFGGHRRHARRSADSLNHYVDHYELKMLVVSLAIILLCCVDALFTLNLINSGIAVEANPVMRAALESSVELFWAAKFIMTASALLFLLMHKNFTVWGVKVLHVLYGFCVMYALLIKYELWLFSLM